MTVAASKAKFISADIGFHSATNHDVAMKTLFESQIEELIVRAGHAEAGDLVCEIVDDKIVVKSTKGNDVEAIFAKAFPDEHKESLKVRTPAREQRPKNREERRANKKNHGRRGKSFYR